MWGDKAINTFILLNSDIASHPSPQSAYPQMRLVESDSEVPKLDVTHKRTESKCVQDNLKLNQD